MVQEHFSPYYVSIEGNLGSGKTSILQELRKTTNAKTLEEPIAKWSDSMKKYYSNPSNYAYDFQTTALLDFLMDDYEGFVVQERSLFSLFYVFTAAFFASKYLSKDQFGVIQNYVKLVLKNSRPLNLMIYLKTSTANSLKRVNLRGRAEESNITYDFLNRLNSLHGNIFSELAGVFKIRVITVDANRPFRQVYKSVVKALRKNVTSNWCDIREQKEMLELEYQDNYTYSRRYSHWVENEKSIANTEREYHDFLYNEEQENAELIKDFEERKLEEANEKTSCGDELKTTLNKLKDEYEYLEQNLHDLQKMIMKILDGKEEASRRDSNEGEDSSWD